MWNRLIDEEITYNGVKCMRFELFQYENDNDYSLNVSLTSINKMGSYKKYNKTYHGKGSYLDLINNARIDAVEYSDFIGYSQLEGLVEYIDFLIFFYNCIQDKEGDIL